MKKEVNLSIKQDFLGKYRDGYPLISKESIVDWSKVTEEGLILNLYSANKKFIAKGYYGIQNKGQGWVLTSQQDVKIDIDFFSKKIKSALAYRKTFFEDAETTAFRVLNGEGDGLGGLTIDYFDGFYMFTWYSLGVYELRDVILEAFKASIDYKGIYQKKRFDGKGKYLDEKDDFLFGQKAPEPLVIKRMELILPSTWMMELWLAYF